MFERTERRFVAWTLLSILIFVCLAINTLIPWALYQASNDTAVFQGLLLGACFAQLNLISVWCALAPGRLVIRVPWSLVLLTLMWYSLVVGNHFSGGLDPSGAFQLGMVLLVCFCAAVLPVSLIGGLLGWRLVTPASLLRRALGEEQFSLGLMLGGMGLASLLLAMGRLVMPPGPLELRALDPELMVAIPLLTIVNLVVTLPSLWAAFAPRRLLPVFAAGCLAHSLLVTVLEMLTFASVGLGSPPLEAWFAFSGVNVGQFLTVFGVLLLLRFMLQFEFRRGPQPQGESPFAASTAAQSPIRVAPDAESPTTELLFAESPFAADSPETEPPRGGPNIDPDAVEPGSV